MKWMIAVISVSMCLCVIGSVCGQRQLEYPLQSIMQLAFAVVTPAQVKGRQITTNMGIMFNIDLPTNMSVWYPWRPDYRRKRSTDTDQIVYKILESTLSLSGFDGKDCLKKSICQMKETPLHNNDIPHQILNILFGAGQKNTSSLWDNLSCDLAFPTCHYTPVDIFMDILHFKPKFVPVH